MPLFLPKMHLTTLQIGSGAFGRVVLATAVGILEWEPKTTVAVKMCKPPVTKPQLVGLMSEIKIMLHLGKHINVVNLLGACTMELSKSKKINSSRDLRSGAANIRILISSRRRVDGGCGILLPRKPPAVSSRSPPPLSQPS